MLHDMDANSLAQFRRKQLGFVFQDFNLLDSLTVKENIMLPMILEKKKRIGNGRESPGACEPF